MTRVMNRTFVPYTDWLKQVARAEALGVKPGNSRATVEHEFTELMGYSRNSHYNWRDKGELPYIAFMAAEGVLSELDKSKHGMDFSAEELKDMAQWAMERGKYDLAKTMIDILSNKK